MSSGKRQGGGGGGRGLEAPTCADLLPEAKGREILKSSHEGLGRAGPGAREGGGAA